MLSSSAVVFFFGKFYTLFNVKRTYLASIFLFLIGSTVCTFAPTSKAFIIGRAISGFGSAAQQGGLINVFAQSFSKRRRPAAVGVAVFVQTVAMVMAPVYAILDCQHLPRNDANVCINPLTGWAAY